MAGILHQAHELYHCIYVLFEIHFWVDTKGFKGPYGALWVPPGPGRGPGQGQDGVRARRGRGPGQGLDGVRARSRTGSGPEPGQGPGLDWDKALWALKGP